MDQFIIVIVALIVFALGASFGSFLNVVVYRLPAGLSLLYPPSRCPNCLHKLGKSENIPVFGWLWLKGRCRWCKISISSRYPLVEAASGLLFLLVFFKFELTLTTVGYWIFLSWLLALSLIDFDTMTLPNALTKSGLVLGLIFQAVIGWENGQIAGLASYLMGGISAAVLGIWLLEAIAFIGAIAFGRVAMGGGDPKLMAMIGAWLGWQSLLLSGLIACGLGAFVGGGAIALGLISRRQPIPFGPFLALGAALTVFWGKSIISIYLQLFFPSF
jgi:leader peptidase (prepilin peptidase)/N-methyltransferase